MTAADVHARLHRLKQLSTGLKAELEAIPKELLPSFPADAIRR